MTLEVIGHAGVVDHRVVAEGNRFTRRGGSAAADAVLSIVVVLDAGQTGVERELLLIG